MNPQALYGALKLLAMATMALMLGAVVYSGYISIMHWQGIGV